MMAAQVCAPSARCVGRLASLSRCPLSRGWCNYAALPKPMHCATRSRHNQISCFPKLYPQLHHCVNFFQNMSSSTQSNPVRDVSHIQPIRDDYLRNRSFPDDALIQQLHQCESIQECLDVYVPNLAKSESSSASHVAACVYWLQMRLYSDLWHVYPWMQDHTYLARLQFYVKGIISDIGKPVLEHPNFPILYKLMEDSIGAYDHVDLTSVLLSLYYLGMSITDPIKTKMIFSLRETISTMPIEVFGLATKSSRTYSQQDSITMRLIFKRVKEELDKLGTDSFLSPEALCSISTALYYGKFIASKDFANRVHDVLLSHIQSDRRDEYMSDLNHVTSYTMMAGSSHFFRKVKGNEHLLRTCIEATVEHIDEMGPGLIGEVCLHFSQRMTLPKVSLAYETRALKLLNNDLKLCEVINLWHVLTSGTKPAVLRKLEGALLEKLSSSDADPLTLSRLSRCLQMNVTENDDILYSIQQVIADNFDDIAKHYSFFFTIMAYLLRVEFYNKTAESVLCQKLWSAVNEHYGLKIQTLPFVSGFLLSHSDTSLQKIIMRKLISGIPQMNEKSLDHLIQGMKIAIVQKPERQRELQQINTVLHSHVAEKLDGITDVRALNKWTNIFVLNNPQPDQLLTRQIMKHYIKYTKGMTSETCFSIIHVFSKTGYFLREVYEDLARLLISADYLDTKVIFITVSLLSNAGYLPRCVGELMPVLLRVYADMLRDDEWYSALVLLYRITVMGWLPEEQLLNLHTIDNISRIDNYLIQNEHKKALMWPLLMFLNRATVIECPQLNVPWFHEVNMYPHDDSKKRRTRGYTESRTNSLVKKIRPALVEAAKGESNLRQHVHSPYHHYIDYEIQLDQDGEPVPYDTNEDETQTNGPLQKVAVLVFSPHHFCYDSSRLRGRCDVICRQLEILDYKVVKLAHYEWNSMALNSKDSKVDYLKSKIYS